MLLNAIRQTIARFVIPITNSALLLCNVFLPLLLAMLIFFDFLVEITSLLNMFCSFGFLFGVSSCLTASSRVSRAVCEYFLDECVRIFCC